MPELPEVETVRRGLAPVMEGALIKEVLLARRDLRFPFPPDFVHEIEDTRCISLSRRGKFLVAELDSGKVVIMHLGMSGSFRVEAGAQRFVPGEYHHPRSSAANHDHVRFRLLGASGPLEVIYNDPRRFGFMDLATAADLDSNRFLAGLGMDPLGNLMTSENIAIAFAGKISSLKSTLLDQRVIAGLGNIYVCESLWQSGLSPFRAAHTIVTKKGRPTAGCRRLEAAIRDVLARAIEAGGSSLRDHRLADGSLGYFQHSFRVYDRAGDPCPRPRCRGTVQKTVQSGRSTYWCRVCQR